MQVYTMNSNQCFTLENDFSKGTVCITRIAEYFDFWNQDANPR